MTTSSNRGMNYGVVGNCRSGALISDTGAVVWLCLPKFDSASIFAKILDEKIGGSFEILPENCLNISQKYDGNTNILVTRFECSDGTFEVYDFMPRYENNSKGFYSPPDLIRYFKPISGKPSFRVVFDPRLEYGTYTTKIDFHDNYVKAQTTKGDYDSNYLYSSMDLRMVVTRQMLTLEKEEFILISYNQKLLQQTVERSYTKLIRTKAYWLTWSGRTTRYRKYNEVIMRSALVLKLLSYQDSGAILAAMTTSLPETVGEVRNWDYRYCWIRDASMVVKVMTRLGHYNLAHQYLKFITDILPEKDERIQIMYGINGEKKLTETTLDHLSGYKNSRPVRVGNAAYKQKQNDIYGILMDVIFQHFDMYTVSLAHSEELWTITRNMVWSVARNWKKPDRGIWEIRTGNRHFTFSKVLCWVAIDRAVKIAQKLLQHSEAEKWIPLREEIRNDILKNAWNEEKQAFTQSYGDSDLDASVLLMEFYGFLPGSDPRFKSTVRAIQRELEHNGLMFRYKNKDDFGTPSSAFTICSFWLVRALYMIGEEEEATRKFDQLLSYSNHLGLFSEDLDFETRQLLGNFPQAYSHLAIVDTAILLAEGKLSRDEQVLQSIH